MSRIIDPWEQYFDGFGQPLVSGKLYFYESGSSSMFKPTFADVAETIPNSNPVILNGDGRCPNVFGSGTYRVVLTDMDDVQILTRDPVGGDQGIIFGAAWNQDVVYTADDVVYEDGSYWISLTNDNQGNQPSTDGGVNWSAINFGGSAAANATYFNHIGGAGTDVLRTGDDSVHAMVRRMAATGSAYGFDGLTAIYSGEGLTQIKTQLTYPFTDDRTLVTSDTDVRIITNLSAGWASRVEYVFSTSGAVTFNGVAAVKQGDAVTLGASSTAKDYNGTDKKVGWVQGRALISGSRNANNADLNNTLLPSAGGFIYTIPTGLGEDGNLIQIYCRSFSITIAQGAGMTLEWVQGGGILSGNRTVSAGSIVTLYRNTSSNWLIYGNGIS